MIAADGPHGRWHYGYDPFGRRIFKESNGRREDFLWDGDVLARSGTVDWFFEPDSFRPMARMDAGVLFHIVNDHLGTPKEMFSEGGDLAWSVDHDTWGTVRRVAGAKRATGRGDYWVENVTYSVSEAAEPAAMLCPIRFQGQWENAESGLYYNRFRYYEPLAGQYLAPDPIGILGGVRPQSYVTIPQLYVDFLGLDRCCAVRYRACRPSFRKGVVDSVWESAVGAAIAQGLDYILDPAGVRIPIDTWKPGQSRTGVWDMGHVPGHEYRLQLERLEQALLPQKSSGIYITTTANIEWKTRPPIEAINLKACRYVIYKRK